MGCMNSIFKYINWVIYLINGKEMGGFFYRFYPFHQLNSLLGLGGQTMVCEVLKILMCMAFSTCRFTDSKLINTFTGLYHRKNIIRESE